MDNNNSSSKQDFHPNYNSTLLPIQNQLCSIELDAVEKSIIQTKNSLATENISNITQTVKSETIAQFYCEQNEFIQKVKRDLKTIDKYLEKSKTCKEYLKHTEDSLKKRQDQINNIESIDEINFDKCFEMLNSKINQ